MTIGGVQIVCSGGLPLAVLVFKTTLSSETANFNLAEQWMASVAAPIEVVSEHFYAWLQWDVT